jgi:hypothetical protein
MEIKDSGGRREFDSGAVRDICDGKGRCDLLPLSIVSWCVDEPILHDIERYVRDGNGQHLVRAITTFAESHYGELWTAMIEVSKHYADGCAKYSERNWEKGIPLHCYIDSGVRHYLKFKRGDEDEPHDRAFLWNMLGALWTHDNMPQMIDLPFAESRNTELDDLLDLMRREIEAVLDKEAKA